jgi:hypothetical protein
MQQQVLSPGVQDGEGADVSAEPLLRGGGSPDLAQGEVPGKDEPALRAAVTDAVRRAIAESNKGNA